MIRMLFTILILVLGQNLNASLNQYLHPSDNRYASFELAIKYLLDRGWSIVYKGYQVILVKNV